MTNQLINGYLPTIGIECHVQLKTKTKLFSAVNNDARSAPPNTLISHIDLGMPGALPVLNAAAVDLAIKAALALGTEPQKFSKFDRKHYFYPDLPKGYQISQYDQPIIVGGYVNIRVDGDVKRINLTRAHLEEDAGKSTHPAGKDYSLVDLNRAGTPLLEIVSEPEIHSAAEAKAYARELYLLMRYADVSDADLYHGNMRFDVNVSVSKDPRKLGIRTETKNLNSFRSVEKAVEYEIKRQITELETGRRIIQETRGWDDAKQKTFSQRSKEEAHDYRYLPEPDIPPIVLTDDMIEAAKKSMPKLPADYRQLFQSLGLDDAATETLVYRPLNAEFVYKIIEKAGKVHAKRVANWIVNISGQKTEDEERDLNILVASPEGAIELSQLVEEGKLSSTAAKDIWTEMSTNGGEALVIAQAKNLLQVSDEAEISKIVDEVISSNEQAANDVRSGELKAIGFLVGQVMKASRGKANPAMVQALIKQKLTD
jgi:aspartyl-tRNA(Asn)/glutamyl-tRNA(Gln) amidotransferase subunit B